MASDPPAANTQPAAEAAVAPSAGMRVAVDPETGKVRPLTAQEAKTLDDMTKARARADAKARTSAGGAKGATTASSGDDSSVAPGETFVDPSGAIGMVLDSSYMVYSVATVGADGKMRMECVTGEDHANDAVHNHKHGEDVAGGTSDETK